MSYDPGAPGDRSQPPGGYGGPGGPPPYGSGYGQQPPPGAWGPPPGGPPQGPPGGYGAPPYQEPSKNFFSGLIDFKFGSYFTTVMLPIVYALGLVYLVVDLIRSVYVVFQLDSGQGILALVFGLIGVAFFAGLLKVGLELVKAVVEGAERDRR
ncbi:DUF4282 domain-containing protein [Pseudonocardia humida]|uniref:DUF4282 domain-containing protein n=1 Tax=Pseudonocardia humida TaxID=2800819 RepID=A0ABT1A177_9PSEU|nr:DUF4282 domain-containing protein [Pseudonocardia humida]MCO1656761.1 DUF4282 domain-containing protein [Pseudonocardia humida]